MRASLFGASACPGTRKRAARVRGRSNYGLAATEGSGRLYHRQRRRMTFDNAAATAAVIVVVNMIMVIIAFDGGDPCLGLRDRGNQLCVILLVVANATTSSPLPSWPQSSFSALASAAFAGTARRRKVKSAAVRFQGQVLMRRLLLRGLLSDDDGASIVLHSGRSQSVLALLLLLLVLLLEGGAAGGAAAVG